MSTLDTQAFLARHGWVMDCESPLQLRHRDTGSVATQLAARLVMNSLRADEAQPPVAHVTEPLPLLLSHIEQLLRWVDAAEQDSGHEAWRTAYDLVFNRSNNKAMWTCLRQLNLDFDWYDPDTSYEEDVQAFASALKGLKKRLEPFMARATAQA